MNKEQQTANYDNCHLDIIYMKQMNISKRLFPGTANPGSPDFGMEILTQELGYARRQLKQLAGQLFRHKRQAADGQTSANSRKRRRESELE